METAALRASLRSALAGAREPPPLDEAGLALARAHRLAGTLYHMRVPMGHEEQRQARQIWAQQAAAHVSRLELLARVWPAGAPAPLLFKGADLAENLYRDPGARSMSDLDLLVSERAFPGICADLRRTAEGVTEPRGERFARELPYERGFRFEHLLLEVHRAPQPPHRGGPDTAGLLARATPGEVGGLAVLYPAPLDRLLLWLVNQAKGSFHGDLADQVDLCLILQALGSPPPWDEIAEAARATGLARPLSLAVARLRESGLWTAALPRLDSGLQAQAARRLLPPLDDPSALPRVWRFQALKLWLASGPARKAIALRAGATAARRLYSQVSGTKTMSPG